MIVKPARGRPGAGILACVVLLCAPLGGLAAQSIDFDKLYGGKLLHGRDANEKNTGVPPGHALEDVSRTIIVTEEWIKSSNKGSRVIQDRHFLSGANLVVTVDGFSVRYCLFTGRSGLSVFANANGYPIGRHVEVLCCEFDGKNENRNGDVAVYGSSLSLRRVHVHDWPRAMWIGDGDVSVAECYMHGITSDGGDAHLENVYVAGGANQAFVRSKFISDGIHVKGDDKLMISASLAIYNENYERGKPFPSFPNLTDIRIEDDYFESDGHYALYGGAVRSKLPKAFAKRMVVRGNVFGRGLQRYCGISGPAVCFDATQPGNEWSGNVWGPRGRSWQPGDPEEGAAIPAPGTN